MRRREFVAGLLGGTVVVGCWSRTGRAQSSAAKIPRIGFLGLPAADSLPQRTEAFRAGLRVSGFLDYAHAGGLMAYGVDFPDLFRRSATYVDKILKGAKPADLPVEQATRFQTILNIKTAKALGLTVPPTLLLRADEVIE